MQLQIKEQLDKKGISRYELAKRIGVTYPTITNLYNGKSTSIKLEILENLCKELDCTPNDIIVSDDPKIQQLLVYRGELNEYNSKNKSDT